MLWFSVILGLNFISLCFKLFIIHYSGGSRGGVWGAGLPYFWTKLRPVGLKNFFWEAGPPPPPLSQGLNPALHYYTQKQREIKI